MYCCRVGYWSRDEAPQCAFVILCCETW
uniref:Uncharacterized protein n=1 Tax=Setaria italica TaxID=4555 RepID=K3ZP03_SETIT